MNQETVSKDEFKKLIKEVSDLSTELREIKNIMRAESDRKNLNSNIMYVGFACISFSMAVAVILK